MARSDELKQLKFLGWGAFGGRIVLCENRDDAMKYVVKSYYVDDRRRWLIREVELLRSMPQHENILQYKEHWFEAQNLLILFAPAGIVLRNVIQQRQFVDNPTQLEVFFKDGLKALHFLEISRIIHGNIDPQSIMVNEHGKAKLFNFELAYHMDTEEPPLFKATRREGSVYVAPEGDSDVSTKSDVYSLGLVYYEVFISTRAHGQLQVAELRKSVFRRKREQPLSTLKFRSLQSLKDAEGQVEMINAMLQPKDERPLASQFIAKLF